MQMKDTTENIFFWTSIALFSIAVAVAIVERV